MPANEPHTLDLLIRGYGKRNEGFAGLVAQVSIPSDWSVAMLHGLVQHAFKHRQNAKPLKKHGSLHVDNGEPRRVRSSPTLLTAWATCAWHRGVSFYVVIPHSCSVLQAETRYSFWNGAPAVKNELVFTSDLFQNPDNYEKVRDRTASPCVIVFVAKNE